MCRAYMLTCEKCGSKEERVHTPCQRPNSGVGCKIYYEDPGEGVVLEDCSKCNGYYVTEKVIKPAKDAFKPKRERQRFNFLPKKGRGTYEGISETVTYLPRRKGKETEDPVEEGADPPGDGPEPEPERSPSGNRRRRRRRRRSQHEPAPGDDGVVLVDQFDLVHDSDPEPEPDSEEGTPGSASPRSQATVGSSQLPSLPSSHTSTLASRNTADSGRRSLSALERGNRERDSNSGSGHRRQH